jgi:hypothetical protein
MSCLSIITLNVNGINSLTKIQSGNYSKSYQSMGLHQIENKDQVSAFMGLKISLKAKNSSMQLHCMEREQNILYKCCYGVERNMKRRKEESL